MEESLHAIITLEYGMLWFKSSQAMLHIREEMLARAGTKWKGDCHGRKARACHSENLLCRSDLLWWSVRGIIDFVFPLYMSSSSTAAWGLTRVVRIGFPMQLSVSLCLACLKVPPRVILR